MAGAPFREGSAHLERVAAARFVGGGRRGAVSLGQTDGLLVRWTLEGSDDGSRRA